MGRFQISSIYLTRACSYRCSSCRVRRDLDKNEFKELSIDQWKKAFVILNDLCAFNVFYGGDPLELGDGLIELVRYATEIGMHYAIASASYESKLTDDFKQRLINAGLGNWSVSIDSLRDLGIDKDINKKSSDGFKALMWFKEHEVEDLHATIVVHKKNLREVVELAKRLNDLGVWFEVTLLQWAKNKHYDFSPPKRVMEKFRITENEKEEFDKVMDILREMRESGKYRIHNPAEQFDLFKKYVLETDEDCEDLYVLSVDSDGVLRLCRDIRWHAEIKEWSIFDLTSEDSIEKFRQDWFEVKKKTCLLCSWDCANMAKIYDKRGKQLGIRAFQHR